MKTMAVAIAVLCLTAGAVAQGSPACTLAPGSSPGEEINSGIAAVYIPAENQDQDKVPPDSVFVDVMPTVRKKLEPRYPQLAAKAGIEGVVWVKLWVDKEGRPRDITVMKSEEEILNQPSIDAARGFEFTPATVGGKPVSVWITIPFKYKLMEKTTGNALDVKASKVGLQGALDAISTILTAEKPEVCEGCYAPDAYAIIGSRYLLFSDAIARRGTPKGLPDERGWKIGMVTTHLDDQAQMATLIVRTEGKGEFHYHTVVCTKDSGGKWRIRHWHTAG